MHHFVHPHHRLEEVYIDDEFLCDGCNSDGHGKRYRCTICTSSFQLHHRCATCPPSITLDFHPDHPLTLVNQNKAELQQVCTLCGDQVNGLYYTCCSCSFHVHPLCTGLIMRVQHTLHSHHMLTLRAATSHGQCMVCGGACTKELWRYQCNDEQCKNVDVHIECAFISSESPPPNPKTVQKSPPPVTDFQGQYPPPPPPPTWYQQPTGWPPYPPPPHQAYNRWVNGYYYPAAYPYPYPYNYYNYPPYIPMQQYGQSSSSSSSNRRRIYAVVSAIATRVAIGVLTGGLLS